jgi:hypothetical protein
MKSVYAIIIFYNYYNNTVYTENVSLLCKNIVVLLPDLQVLRSIYNQHKYIQTFQQEYHLSLSNPNLCKKRGES